MQPVNEQENQFPTPFQKAVCWTALSGIAITTTIALVLGFMYGMGRLFLALEPVLLPVLIAGILTYLLSPCVAWVQKKTKRRVFAVLTVMLGAGLVVGGLGAAIIPPLVKQTGELVTQRREIFSNAVEAGKQQLETNNMLRQGVDMLYNKVLRDARQEAMPKEDYEALSHETTPAGKMTAILNFNSGYLTEKLLEWGTAGTRAISGIGMLVIGTVMVPVFLFYFLLESEHIRRNWHSILPLWEGRFRTELVNTLSEINGYIVSFIRGQMLVSVVDAVLLAIALKIMGLPYAVTLAAVAALLGIIPYIGMISTWIPAMLIAWFTWHDVTHLVAVSLIFGSVSQFDGWVLQPRIVGNSVKMHDLTVMFSVLFWSYVIGGVIGALLAVPLTASLKVLFTRYVWNHPRWQQGK